MLLLCKSKPLHRQVLVLFIGCEVYPYLHGFRPGFRARVFHFHARKWQRRAISKMDTIFAQSSEVTISVASPPHLFALFRFLFKGLRRLQLGGCEIEKTRR